MVKTPAPGDTRWTRRLTPSGRTEVLTRQVLNKQGHLHCVDGPADVNLHVLADGIEAEWHREGFVHRTDGGPSMIYLSPSKATLFWHDQLQGAARLDGPTCISTSPHRCEIEWAAGDGRNRLTLSLNRKPPA